MKFYSVDRKLNKFSDFIRGEMARQGKYQDEIAYQIGISQSQFSKRLRGKIDWSMREVVQLSEILGFSLGDWE